MNNKLRRLITPVVFIVFAVLVYTKEFIGDDWVKNTLQVLMPLGGVYSFALSLFPENPLLKKINKFLRKSKIFRLIFPADIRTKLESNNVTQARSEALTKTSSASQILEDGIKDSEIYVRDFKILKKFNPGSEYYDQLESELWENHVYDRQFQAILGESGNGKSFELIKRLRTVCEIIKTDVFQGRNTTDEKVPVYIELKSLKGPLDHETIFEYLTREGSTYSTMSSERLKHLIHNHQLIYFFDGLDEVERNVRIEYLGSIIDFSKDSTVYFTCRTKIYYELKEKEELKDTLSIYYPATTEMLPITSDAIKTIIKEYPLTLISEGVRTEMVHFVENKDELLEHLSFPLILNLFLKVFNGLSESKKVELQNGDQQKVLALLWEAYEDYIAKRKHGELSADTIIQLRTYSVWIAKIMGQESFVIDAIQPDWLKKVNARGKVSPDIFLQVLYYFATRIIVSALIGVAMGCIIATPTAFLGNSILGGFWITCMASFYKFLKRKRLVVTKTIKIIYVFILALTILTICGVYQGYTIPRAPEDMYKGIFSFTEAVSGILLGLVLSIFFSYRIIFETEAGGYIVPIEKYKFDWRHAWKEGIYWGVPIGLFIAIFALVVKHFAKGSSFIYRWLNPFLKDLSSPVFGEDNSKLFENEIVFVFAFFVTFTVSFLIIVILASRYEDEKEIDTKKNLLNYGINRSIWSAFKHTAIIATIVSIIYGLALIGLGIESLNKGIQIVLGMSLLALLWVGGMEVINHIILRLNLFVRGISPLNYDPWFQITQDMAMIKTVGPKLNFYHNTLADYLHDYPLVDNTRLKVKRRIFSDKFIYIIIIFLGAYLIWHPVMRRYYVKEFWTQPTMINANIKADVLRLNDSIFVIEKSGKLQLSVTGKINVGTFTGFVRPEGTSTAFMGMPIKSAYNLPNLEGLRHAALLIRKLPKGCDQWSSYYYATEIKDSKKLYKWAQMKVGDQLQFAVNDREYQNNYGKFDVTLRICDSCK